jgi:hypothetical protein
VDGFATFITPTLGAGGVVLLVVLMVLRGLLVPRSTVDMVVADKDRQIDVWRALADGRLSMIELQQSQLDLMMGTARTTERVLDAVSEAARRSQGGGDRALAQAEDK